MVRHAVGRKCRGWPLPNAFLAHSCLAVSLRLDSRGRGPHAVQLISNEAWLTQVGDERQTRLGTHGDFSAPLTMMLTMCRGQMRCEMDRLH